MSALPGCMDAAILQTEPLLLEAITGSELVTQSCDLAPHSTAIAHLRGNKPVLIRAACSQWDLVSCNHTAAQTIIGLASSHGDALVPVVDETSSPGYGSGHRTASLLSDYLRIIGEGKQPAYAKDFHYYRHCPSRAGYSVPAFCADDWLNWHCDATGGGDDYRFMYCGPPGSHTPLHHDVLYSASWSVNVTGWKLWVLVPPDAAASHLYGAFGNLRVTTTLTDGERGAIGRILGAPLGRSNTEQPAPDGAPSDASALRRHIALQGRGDLVFVPPGWHHEVYNVGPDPVVSINHNWFSGLSLPLVWGFLRRELAAVEAAIGDLRRDMGEREWLEHCQTMLRANCGYSLDGFLELVANKASLLLRQLGGREALAAETALDGPGSACVMVPIPDAPWAVPPQSVIADSLRRADTVLRDGLAHPYYARLGAGLPGPAWADFSERMVPSPDMASAGIASESAGKAGPSTAPAHAAEPRYLDVANLLNMLELQTLRLAMEQCRP